MRSTVRLCHAARREALGRLPKPNDALSVPGKSLNKAPFKMLVLPCPQRGTDLSGPVTQAPSDITYTLYGLLLHLIAGVPLPCSLQRASHLSVPVTPSPRLHHPHTPTWALGASDCSCPSALQPSERQ